MGTKHDMSAGDPFLRLKLQLLRMLPDYLQRVLMMDAGRGELGYFLKKRPGVEVHGIVGEPQLLEVARLSLDGAAPPPPYGDAIPFPKASFHCILTASPEARPDTWLACLPGLLPFLWEHGCLVVAFRNEACTHDGAEPAGEGLCFDGVTRAAAEHGFLLYGRWTANRDGMEEEAEEPAGYLLLFVRADYNPMAHAQSLRESGRIDLAYAVLTDIPETYLANADAAASIRMERLLCLLEWIKNDPEQDPLEFFAKAQELFYGVVAHEARFVAAYQCQAEFWRLLGDERMAARLLSSIHFAAPDDGVARQMQGLLPAPSSARQDDRSPEWDPGAGPRRVLYVLHPRFHYGLDVLYDGLCRVLGVENVVDFPYKPSLHGTAPKEMAHYPCSFDHPGREYALEQVLDELRGGRFDVVLYGDCECGLEQETALRLAEAAGNTPVFIVDEIDEAANTRYWVQQRLGSIPIAGYFKREMLACADYGPNAFPLPFAYPDARAAEDACGVRERQFFWAGHRKYGTRRLFLEHLETRFGLDLNENFSQEEYSRVLRDSRIGLNCFGFGFDTVRYWELPAQGCLLLSEQLPIRIPHDFVDGETAVFFDDLRELEKKVEYLLGHPEDVAAIAAAGHEHFMKHHTSSARARQLLGWVAGIIR